MTKLTAARCCWLSFPGRPARVPCKSASAIAHLDIHGEAHVAAKQGAQQGRHWCPSLICNCIQMTLPPCAHAHLDVHEEAHEAVEERPQEVGQLAHHAGRLLARFAQRDQELGRQLARAGLQVPRVGNLCGRHGRL